MIQRAWQMNSSQQSYAQSSFLAFMCYAGFPVLETSIILSTVCLLEVSLDCNNVKIE